MQPVASGGVTRRIIDSTAGEVTADLERRGIDPARPVIVTIEPDDWIAQSRTYARPTVVAAGLTDSDIDRIIKQAQKDVEPCVE